MGWKLFFQVCVLIILAGGLSVIGAAIILAFKKD